MTPEQLAAEGFTFDSGPGAHGTRAGWVNESAPPRGRQIGPRRQEPSGSQRGPRRQEPSGSEGELRRRRDSLGLWGQMLVVLAWLIVAGSAISGIILINYSPPVDGYYDQSHPLATLGVATIISGAVTASLYGAMAVLLRYVHARDELASAHQRAVNSALATISRNSVAS